MVIATRSFSSSVNEAIFTGLSSSTQYTITMDVTYIQNVTRIVEKEQITGIKLFLL